MLRPPERHCHEQQLATIGQQITTFPSRSKPPKFGSNTTRDNLKEKQTINQKQRKYIPFYLRERSPIGYRSHGESKPKPISHAYKDRKKKISSNIKTPLFSRKNKKQPKPITEKTDEIVAAYYQSSLHQVPLSPPRGKRGRGMGEDEAAEKKKIHAPPPQAKKRLEKTRFFRRNSGQNPRRKKRRRSCSAAAAAERREKRIEGDAELVFFFTSST